MPVVRAEEQVSKDGAAIHHGHRLVQVGILGAVNPDLGRETRWPDATGCHTHPEHPLVKPGTLQVVAKLKPGPGGAQLSTCPLPRWSQAGGELSGGRQTPFRNELMLTVTPSANLLKPRTVRFKWEKCMLCGRCLHEVIRDTNKGAGGGADQAPQKSLAPFTNPPQPTPELLGTTPYLPGELDELVAALLTTVPSE